MEPEDYIEKMLPALYADLGLMGLYVSLADDMTDSSLFGDLRNYAIALRAMHTYSLDANHPTGDAGIVIGKSEGNAAIRFAAMKADGHSDLQMTHWGRRLLSLIRARGGSVSISADPLAVL